MSTEANYLRDLGCLLRDAAREAKRDADSARGTKNKEWKSGYSFAYMEVISLMQQQADAFGLPLENLALDGIDPERDLL